ncbi:MAG: hypothetical protein AAFP22_13050 [Planctomycetota bacterium]
MERDPVSDADPTPGGAPAVGGAPTLGDAIREGLSRREALRLGERLAAEIAARHARGLVHGALTPRAVILQRDGTVGVLEPDEAGERVLQVLRYASPEIARREEPSVGSDTFSLALIVRELVEGIPARRSEGEQVALDAVDGRVSVPHGFEGELQGLLVLAASPHVDQRPSAAHFAAALRGATQIRGVSRKEALVALVAALAVLMLVFAMRRSAAAREVADQQFADSRAAIEGLLAGTYPELGRVRDVARLAQAGERALASLDVPDAAQDPDGASLLARALLWNGRAQLRLGDVARARAHFERAVEVVDAAPTASLDGEVRLPSLLELCTLAIEAHDLEAAQALNDRAIELGEAVESPGPEVRLALGRAQIQRGQFALDATGTDEDTAREAFERARDLLDGLAGAGTELIGLRAEIRQMQARLAGLTGDRDSEIELLAEHVELVERLVEESPGSVEPRAGLAAANDELGRARAAGGDFPGAVEAWRAASEGWRLLAETEDAPPGWRLEWARTTGGLAEALDRIGGAQEATELHALAIEELERLVGSGLGGELLPLLIERHLSAAEGLLAAGDLRRARVRLASASKRLGSIPADRLPSFDPAPLRARALIASAELSLATSEWSIADQRASLFFGLYERRSEEGKIADLQRLRVRGMLVSASTRAARGSSEDAGRLRRRARDVAADLVAQDDGDAVARALLARTLFVLGLDAEAARELEVLESVGYRGLELSAVRAATAHIRRR